MLSLRCPTANVPRVKTAASTGDTQVLKKTTTAVISSISSTPM